MNITILNVVTTTKPGKQPGKTYQMLEVAYKNNTFGGKVEGKNITQYSKVAFDALATAQPGSVFDITVEKVNGFNEWVQVQPSTGAVQQSVPASNSGTQASNRGGNPVGAVRSSYETPEERAQRQVLIVRQSSLGSAVSTLSVGAKSLDPAKVLELAQRYNDWVFQKGGTNSLGGATGFDDVPSFDKEMFEPPQVD